MGRLEIGEQPSVRQYGEAMDRGREANDGGFIVAGFLLNGLRFATRKTGRNAILAAGAGVLSGMAMACGHNMDYVGATETADLQLADTSVDVDLIEFDLTNEINVAKAYFDVTVDAQNITYKIDTQPFDVVQDCSGNKQIDGVGAVRFAVPFDALTQYVNPATKKIDLEVDPQEVTAVAYWNDAGPEEHDYTISGGKKNFDDRSGFCRSVIQALAGHVKLVNFNSLANAMEDLDAAVAHDLRKKGLEVFGEECPKSIEPTLREAIIAGITRNVAELGRKSSLGEVIFQPGALQWNRDEGPSQEVRQRRKISSTYQIQDFRVDRMSCQVDPAAVPGLIGGDL